MSKSVLIVDDSDFARMKIKKVLENNGFSVVGEAASVAAALASYEKLHPDLVTMDMVMKGDGGVEGVARLKKIDPAAKVLMVSAMGQEMLMNEARDAGALGFLVKPYLDDDLVATARQLVGLSVKE